MSPIALFIFSDTLFLAFFIGTDIGLIFSIFWFIVTTPIIRNKELGEVEKSLQRDQIILEQLKQFNPGVQTLLARVSELTKMKKSLVEQSINRLLEASPDLGTYDSLSQVFICGNQIVKRIDELLEKFEEDTKFKL